MNEPIPITSSFPTASCIHCAKNVLTYVALNSGGAEERLCTRCDLPIASEIRWVSAVELESQGYYFGSQPPASSGGGCGGGCGSCAVKKN